ESPLPDLSVGALTAPAATGLYQRLAREGRLLGDIWQATAGSPFETNIRPAQMSRDALLAGAARLGAELYRPENYQRRMLNLIDQYGSGNRHGRAARSRGGRRIRAMQTLRRISARGRPEAEMVADVLRFAARKPAVLPTVMHSLVKYEQVRHVLDYA